ncbi:lipopolysaccharide biosynthesis protein [Paenibacillus spongiae]|uniref:Oligosaccharide flippase family protein n=1 Tax=Paenibacillus spongiae TaxID=2909671 RepID=A0ABY5SG10_9BACL|nr:oligosaccharide flippase family protein [Paenibacillus spongiae]UVI31608.1 oligosaccharide flippase family protein [Paenibacillus spongiae]
MTIKNKLASLRRNRDFNNVIYSLMSYAITPVILIISTPLLLKYLGDVNYGVWILINSIINLLAVSNFGLGNALIKLGSELNKDDQLEQFNALFSVSFTISIMLALLINVIILLFGTYIFPLFVSAGSIDSILSMSYLLSGVVGLRIVNSIISGAYMSKQRYDINSKMNIVYNLVTSICFTVLTVMYGELHILVIFLFLSSVLLIVVNYFVAKAAVPGIRFKLSLNKRLFHKIFGYGMYSWVQVVISTLNAQADKLIIGGLLGAKVLGFYTICMQIVIKIHEIPAAAGGYLFAKFSDLSESEDRNKIRSVYYKAISLSFLFVAVSGALAFLFARHILSLWINPEFAEQHYMLFRLLVVSVSMGALGVVPYYFLNGTGFVKLNTVISLLTSVMIVILFFLLIPRFGVTAIGIAKFAGVPLVLFSIYFIEKKVMRKAAVQKEEPVNLRFDRKGL